MPIETVGWVHAAIPTDMVDGDLASITGAEEDAFVRAMVDDWDISGLSLPTARPNRPHFLASKPVDQVHGC
ncbi:hypothetical protein KUH32_17195 [Thalassococcus sp. CAU 1522]|uniref:Uncharacterized protein n=1 Tax=Thalassococcus arenae TaxID=2851652 RepID=A0ABS6NCU0_9RHOB|nr:hypothetical protein [Thalassococcus arenae]MBV2361502.1 hypothetical protein [Thalassococcus arenae]